jgi:hypothetical protein
MIAGGPYRASPVGRCLVHMHCEQCMDDFLLTAVGAAGLQMPPCFACVHWARPMRARTVLSALTKKLTQRSLTTQQFPTEL